MKLLSVLLLQLAVSGCAAARVLHQGQTTPQAKPADSSQDKVLSWNQLPVGPKLGSLHHSGYITMDAAKGRKMFYVFGEAETNPKEAPVIFWMNGGPGCSSVGLTFMRGSGAYIPVSNSSMLLLNNNAFTKFANVIWLEQPYFTGFSTSKDEGDRTSDDTKTAQGMLDFLLKWYQRFPQHKGAKLFLAGQSYAGHYGPLLAKRILDYNAWATKQNALGGTQHQIINLGGLAMGNAWTDAYYDNTATLEFWYDNALISKSTYDGLKKCDMSTGALWRTDGPSGFSEECEKLRDDAYKQIGDVDKYGLNAPVCVGPNGSYPEPDYEFKGWAMFDPCAISVIPALMTNRTMQLALGAIEGSEPALAWKACVGSNLTYSVKDMVASMVPVYKELNARGLPVIFYNGETDAYVPLAGSRAWVESMNLPLADPNVSIRQWKDTHTGQPGGTVVEYKGFTRVAVREAGHSLGSWAPYKNSLIVRTFLEGGKLPAYSPRV